MPNILLRNPALLASLKTALAQEQLSFVVQPKFSSALTIVGVEVLARWNSQIYGRVSPEVFVPLAEANGLASRLGDLAARYSAHCAATLARHGRPIPVSVNISASQIMEGGLRDKLLSLCSEFEILPGQLELELTESALLQDSRAIRGHMASLSKAGFNIALDDFGSGYSCLSYLRSFHFDTIKVDRMFLTGLGRDKRTKILLTWVIGLCKSLRIDVVVEGVETYRQLLFLQQQEVDQLQGFLLSPPISLCSLLEDKRLHCALSPESSVGFKALGGMS